MPPCIIPRCFVDDLSDSRLSGVPGAPDKRLEELTLGDPDALDLEAPEQGVIKHSRKIHHFLGGFPSSKPPLIGDLHGFSSHV